MLPGHPSWWAPERTPQPLIALRAVVPARLPYEVNKSNAAQEVNYLVRGKFEFLLQRWHLIKTSRPPTFRDRPHSSSRDSAEVGGLVTSRRGSRISDMAKQHLQKNNSELKKKSSKQARCSSSSLPEREAHNQAEEPGQHGARAREGPTSVRRQERISLYFKQVASQTMRTLLREAGALFWRKYQP